MKKIYHFTNVWCARNIDRMQKIELEGRQLEKQYDRWVRTGEIDSVPPKTIAECLIKMDCNRKSYAKTGRYVWFSEEPPTTAYGTEYAFEFDPEEIGAIPWTEMKKKILRNASTKAKKMIRSLDKVATECGDDPSKYWVLDRELSLIDANYQLVQFVVADRSVA